MLKSRLNDVNPYEIGPWSTILELLFELLLQQILPRYQTLVGFSDMHPQSHVPSRLIQVFADIPVSLA